MSVLLYEFKDGMNRYLATRTAGPWTLDELIAFNERERAREMPYFGQEFFVRARDKGPLTDREYIEARRRSLEAAGSKGIDAVLEKHHLDALIAPTTGPAWTTDLVNGDHFIGGSASSAPAIAGYPHVTVPAGYLHGLPIGISFIGTAWSDSMLIRFAYAFEQATRARQPPPDARK
jgi:amidase